MLDRYGVPKVHPVDIERQSRVAAARMFAQLNIKAVGGPAQHSAISRAGKRGPKPPVIPFRPRSA